MTRGPVIDAVLPLAPNDFDRASILFASLEKFFHPLGRLWIVAPDRDVEWMAARVARQERFTVLAESEVVPELSGDRRLARTRPHRARQLLGPPPSGWQLQQLIKLAIAERIDTACYLTLDADVICVRHVDGNDLIVDGRAISNRRTGEDFRAQWYESAERVLGMPRSGYVHGVTPALLSREAALLLQRYLALKAPSEWWHGFAARRLGLRRRHLSGWRRYLLRSVPWTEYTLYFTYLEATGRYDDFHFPGAAGKETLYGGSFWLADQDFAAWDPAEVFEAETPYQFMVVQSNLPHISTDDVWEKVGRYLR